MKILDVKINIRPMGMNNCYSQSKGGRRFMTPEGKAYKKLIYKEASLGMYDFNIGNFNCYRVEFEFGVTSAIRKDGGIKKRHSDYDGFIKLAQDSIFEAIGVDDALIVEATIKKKFDGNYVNARVYGLSKPVSESI